MFETRPLNFIFLPEMSEEETEREAAAGVHFSMFDSIAAAIQNGPGVCVCAGCVISVCRIDPSSPFHRCQNVPRSGKEGG